MLFRSHGALFVGSPATVAQRLASTMRTLELDRLGLHYAIGQIPAALRRQSIELLGREVFPRVRELLAQDPGEHAKPGAALAEIRGPVRSTHAPVPAAR